MVIFNHIFYSDRQQPKNASEWLLKQWYIFFLLGALKTLAWRQTFSLAIKYWLHLPWREAGFWNKELFALKYPNFFKYVYYRYLQGFCHDGTETLWLKRLSLSAGQLAMHVDLMSTINWNLESFKTVKKRGEDEWSFLWKAIHDPWVSVWENCCKNLVPFLMAGTPVVTNVHGHMQKKINCA